METDDITLKGNADKSFKQIFGKYRYVLSSKKGQISLVEFKALWGDKDCWEIYALKGNFFERVEKIKEVILLGEDGGIRRIIINGC